MILVLRVVIVVSLSSISGGLLPGETEKRVHPPEPPVSGRKPAESTARSTKAQAATAARRRVEKTEAPKLKRGRVNQTQWTNYEGRRHHDWYY